MKRTLSLALLFSAVLVAVCSVANAQTNAKTQFNRMCALCHGEDGKAQTTMGKTVKAADLTSATVQSQTDAQLYSAIAHGKGKMAAYEGILGKQGVDSMVKYVRTNFGKTKKK